MVRFKYSKMVWLALLCSLCLWSCKRKVAALPPPSSPVAAAVQARSPAPTVTLRADRSTVVRGQAATLTVTSQNATNVTIEPGLGSIPANGSRQVSPSSSVTYVATAIGPGGNAVDSVRLTVSEPLPAVTPVRAVSPVTNVPVGAPSLDQRILQEMKPVYFDYDKADLREDQMPKIRAEIAFLTQNPNLRFLIEGRCDERGSEQYNQALGERRANVVKQYFVGQGIDGQRISIISYGEERPLCHENSDSCYQENRQAGYKRVP